MLAAQRWLFRTSFLRNSLSRECKQVIQVPATEALHTRTNMAGVVGNSALASRLTGASARSSGSLGASKGGEMFGSLRQFLRASVKNGAARRLSSRNVHLSVPRSSIATAPEVQRGRDSEGARPLVVQSFKHYPSSIFSHCCFYPLVMNHPEVECCEYFLPGYTKCHKRS